MREILSETSASAKGKRRNDATRVDPNSDTERPGHYDTGRNHCRKSELQEPGTPYNLLSIRMTSS